MAMARSQALSGSRSRAFGASRPRAAVVRAPGARRASPAVQVSAFFNFLAPKPATSNRAQELADALLEVVGQTKPGSPVSPVAKAEVEELVAELEPLCMKNPLKSPLLWGTYDVVYCSKPSAVGGPLTKGPGPVLAAGQRARQILQDDGTLINEVSFKTLGLLPGFSRQYGQIRPLSGDTFLLSIKEGEISTGLGSQAKSFDIERKIQIVYLDENLRIARFLPSEESPDSEQEASGEGPEEEEILFVFQRVAEEEEEQEEVLEEEEEEEEQDRPASPVLNLFGGTRKVESMATQAERRVQEQRTRKGTQPFFLGGGGGGRSRDEEEEEEEREDPRAARARAQAERRAAQEQAKQEAASARAQEQARLAKERERAEREKEAERARAQREKEAEARARAQQEAREAAEAEKAARAERQAQIRELLAELGEELKEAQAEAREAQKEAREVARENQGVLRQVSKAEAAIAEAERDVQQVAAALDEAVSVRKGVEQQFKSAQQAVREVEAAYKQKVGAR